MPVAELVPPTEYTAARARLAADLPSGARVINVEVYGPSIRFGSWSGPQVNWPGIGSVAPEDARAFAELLVEAARVAERLAPAVQHMNRDAALAFLGRLTNDERRAALGRRTTSWYLADTDDLLAAVRRHLGLESPS